MAQAQPQGNPDYPGRLEFIYADEHAVAQIDGQYLTEVLDGKVTQEFTQGRHSLKIYLRKGLFNLTLKQDTVIDIPGGFVVRATIRNDQLAILDVVPIPGQGKVAAPAPAAEPAPASAPAPTSAVSTTMTLGINGISMDITTTQTMQGAPAAAQPAPASSPAKPVSIQKGKIIFMSENGQCEVYLDGKLVADIGLPGVGEAAKATVFDLQPSTYKIKITSFSSTWYDGKLTIGNGETLKIQIDPDTFEIISRDQQP
jgi:hypothetical protein